MTIPFHPYADIFPMLEPGKAALLQADIAANGLRERIVILDGKILDGRNRYCALVAAGLVEEGLPPADSTLWISHFRRFVAVQDGEPLAFVLSHNVHRRDLTPGQRALVAWRLATRRPGHRSDRADDSESGYLSLARAAELMGVSLKSVERVGRTLRLGSAGVEDLLAEGVLGPSDAEAIALHTAAAPVVEPDAPPALRREVEAMEPDTPAAPRREVDAVRAPVLSTREIAPAPASGVIEQINALRQTDPGAVRDIVRQVKAARSGAALAAVQNCRVLPPDGLDYAPTPPWATRALLRNVLPHIGVSLTGMVVRDPCCGEGHMSTVLAEEAGALDVWASDVFDYSVDGVAPSGWGGVRDYLDDDADFAGADWVVMNPPFGDKAERFVERALGEAAVGVASFARLGWLASVGRYERLYAPNPPTLIAIFAERVPLHMGRWEPEGVTQTDYVWLVWVKGRAPLPPLWIPPGRRGELSAGDDIARFTAHPVRALTHHDGLVQHANKESAHG